MTFFVAQLRNLEFSLYRSRMSHQSFSTRSKSHTNIDDFEHQKYSILLSLYTSFLNSTISDSTADVWKHETNSYIYVLFRVLWFDRLMLIVSWMQTIFEISSSWFWNIISSFNRPKSRQTNQKFSKRRFSFYTYAEVFDDSFSKWLNRDVSQSTNRLKTWRHSQDQ
jgi:hypothetical protein